VPLIDSYNRIIDYLRVSVTDRCNFRCVYCMPEEGAPVAPSADILTADEIVRAVAIASSLGMTKIRLTGGEPLVRKDIVEIVRRIAALPGVDEISMTTNGFLLAPLACQLVLCGLNRINISLDTLRAERFSRLARRGNLEQTLAGIEAALSAGLTPVKLNCVVMRGWNDDEVADFAKWTLKQPVDVRFIEMMPINWSTGDDSIAPPPVQNGSDASSGRDSITLYANTQLNTFKQSFHGLTIDAPHGQLDAAQMRKAFVPTDEIRSNIEMLCGALQPASLTTNGPARTFRLPGALGTVGFISQITNDMCVDCNRLRLTADGQLRPCLMADGEVDLRELLRNGASDDDIAEMFRITVLHKPKEHRLEDGLAPVGRNMSQLGG
jgi:cyclic pyranopterin phosphate synthase